MNKNESISRHYNENRTKGKEKSTKGSEKKNVATKDNKVIADISSAKGMPEENIQHEEGKYNYSFTLC